MTKNRITFFVVTLFLGFVGGLVLMGRLSPEIGTAAPSPQTKPAAISPTGAVLPNLSDVAELAIQASVNISSTQYVRVDPFFQFYYRRGAVQAQTSLGSGVIVKPDGYIITNFHVVQNAAADIKVTLPDGRELPGKIIGTDETTDLAVVKVAVQGLATLPWADSSKVRVAEWVLAVGNPFALSQTVTLGIVSNVNRHSDQLGGYNDMIQTDAAINPGNSGGALVNTRGEIVGINTMIVSESGGFSGLGFAIPAKVAQQVMELLIKDGEVPHGSMGIVELQTVDPDRAERAGLGRLHGVLLGRMTQNSSAAKAGLQMNDIIVSIDGKSIVDREQLLRLLVASKIGSTVKVDVLRDARPMSFTMAIEKLQASTGR